MKIALHRLENVVAKGENAGYQHFQLLPQCFYQLGFFLMVCKKVRIVWLKHLTFFLLFITQGASVAIVD